jgi:hypothetical protein
MPPRATRPSPPPRSLPSLPAAWWRRRGRTATRATGQPAIRVGAGASPVTTVVPSGVPVRLTLRLDGPSRERDAVVFRSLGRLVTLTPGVDVTLELGPLPVGDHVFESCAGTPLGTLRACVGAAPLRPRPALRDGLRPSPAWSVREPALPHAATA